MALFIFVCPFLATTFPLLLDIDFTNTNECFWPGLLVYCFFLVLPVLMLLFTYATTESLFGCFSDHNENWFWGRCTIEMRSVLHIMRWCKILVVIWSSSDVHSYPTKCCDALALTATDSGSGREEEKQTIQIFSISAFSSNSPTISFSGSSYFQKEKSDHGFSRLPDNFRIPLLKNLKPPSTQL